MPTFRDQDSVDIGCSPRVCIFNRYKVIRRHVISDHREQKLRISRSHLSFFFFVFLGLPLWHIEVPRLGVELELWLPAYTTATVT